MADKIDYIKVIKDVCKKEIKEGDEETKLIVDLVKKLADINTIKYTKQAINKQKRMKSRLSQRTGNQYTGNYSKSKSPKPTKSPKPKGTNKTISNKVKTAYNSAKKKYNQGE
jgi:hypothetical protein